MGRNFKKSWPFNFGCLPESYPYNKSKVVILPVPYEVTTTYKKGTGDAPLAIIQASRFMELYDEELRCEPYKIGIYTEDELEFSLKSPSTSIRQIESAVEKILRDDKFPVILGGEHTITLGAVRAAVKKYPKLNVLQLDAHLDLRDTYQESKFSHATVMRRVLEVCPIIQVGIRSLSSEEEEFIRKKKGLKTKIFGVKDLKKKRDLKKRIVKELNEKVYLTIDMDVFDPSIMPAVGTPEPGGLGWEEVIEILRLVFENKEVVGLDVVELNPLPNFVSSDFITAKLIYKLIGYKFFNRKVVRTGDNFKTYSSYAR